MLREAQEEAPPGGMVMSADCKEGRGGEGTTPKDPPNGVQGIMLSSPFTAQSWQLPTTGSRMVSDKNMDSKPERLTFRP